MRVTHGNLSRTPKPEANGLRVLQHGQKELLGAQGVSSVPTKEERCFWKLRSDFLPCEGLPTESHLQNRTCILWVDTRTLAALAVLYHAFLSFFLPPWQKPTRLEAPRFPGAALWTQTKEGAICSGLACVRLWSRQSSGSRVWARTALRTHILLRKLSTSAFARAGSLQAMV